MKSKSLKFVYIKDSGPRVMFELLHLCWRNVEEKMAISDHSALVGAGHSDYLRDSPLRVPVHKDIHALRIFNFTNTNSAETFIFTFVEISFH